MAETTIFPTVFVILSFYLIRTFFFLSEYVAQWNINHIIQYKGNDGPTLKKYPQKEGVFSLLWFRYFYVTAWKNNTIEEITGDCGMDLLP